MGYFKVGVRLTRSEFIALLIPYLTTSTWYYLFYSQMLSYTLRNLELGLDWIGIYFNIFVVLSLILNSFFIDRVDKLHIIYFWATSMPILMVLLVSTSHTPCILVFVAVLAWIFGMGLLAYPSYLCALTSPKERGRIGGTIVFASLLTAPGFLSLSKAINPNYAPLIYISLGVSTFIIQFFKPREIINLASRKSPPAIQRYNKKMFLLYLIPWLVFCSINSISGFFITVHLSSQFSDVVFTAYILEYLAAGFSALLAGLLADWIGRRVTLLIGLIVYGISVAFSGLVGVVFSPEFLFIIFIMAGITWGAFIAVYTLVVWGDFASADTCAPCYAAGFIPFYFTQGLGRYMIPLALKITWRDSALVNSSLILLSTIPLLYAPEILSREEIEKMRFHRWIQRAKKISKDYQSLSNGGN